MRPDLLAIGETMAMVTPLDGSRLDSRAPLGLRSGGAESNVAAMASRLGCWTAWASQLGTDPLGDVVLDDVAASGVDVQLVDRDPSRPTAVYFKDPGPQGTQVYYYRSGSAASAMGPDLLTSWTRAQPRIVHVSGITAALSRSCADLLRAVVQDRAFGDALVSFDVNHRARLWDRPAADELLEHAQASDVVFVGRDEAEALWGTTTADDVRRLVDRPRYLVVKDGAVEAVSFTPGGTYRYPARPVDVVDVVGAGDAFAAGWLAAHLNDEDEPVKLAAGHHVARAVLASPSDLADVETITVLTARRTEPNSDTGATLPVPPRPAAGTE